MTLLTYLLVLFVTLGSPFFAIPLGGINLSLYRITLILLVFMSIYLILIKDRITKVSFGRRAKVTPYQLFYVIWLIYAVLSILWVESYSRWFFAMFYLTFGIASIIFVSASITDEIKLNKIINLAFISTVFHHFFGWIEVLFNKYYWADLDLIDPNGLFLNGIENRFPITTFANQNDFATLILAGIFLAFIIFKNTQKLWIKVIVTFYLFSGLLLILLTDSRLNIISLLIGIGTIILFKILDYKSLRFIIKGLLSISLIGAILFLLVQPFKDSVFKVISWVFNGPVGPATSPRYRLNMIINGFSFLIKTYGIGVGAGNLEIWMENDRIVTVDAPNMHNWFMEILTNYGLIIFIMYTLLYLLILIKLLHFYKHAKNRIMRNTSQILFVYLIVFIFSSSASSSMTPAEWQWVLWGIIIGFVQYNEQIKSISENTNHIHFKKEKTKNESF